MVKAGAETAELLKEALKAVLAEAALDILFARPGLM
jgi:hypothetical protein